MEASEKISENATGSATITVTQNPCTVIRQLPVGQTFNGSLVASDCKLSDSTAFQRFEFTLAAPQKLEILMNSSAVDSYLFLTDASLNLIDEDDDGGTGTNARILRMLPAGRYFILANTYDAFSFGAYTVAVRTAPSRESARRALIEAYVAKGDLAAAVNEYDEYQELLRSSLGGPVGHGLDGLFPTAPAWPVLRARSMMPRSAVQLPGGVRAARGGRRLVAGGSAPGNPR